MSVEDIGAPTGPAPPARPAGVPLEAAWNLRTDEWELAPTEGAGRKTGLVRAWRADGSLASEYAYHDDALEGAFKRFHPDGSVAREGALVHGEFHGTVVAHASAAPTPEPLQTCCVPEGAWQLERDYDHGRLLDTRWYDRAGVHILPSGAPHPVRPAAVPRAARFDEQREQWVEAHYSGGHPEGVWRRWARDGVLRERDEYREGDAHGLWQRFDALGALVEEGQWREGKRGGDYRRLGVPPELYADARVYEERGAFDRDQAVGTWSLLDAGGVVLHTRALGAALDDAAVLASRPLAELSPSTPATVSAWQETAHALEREGRPAEAILAAARAAAAAGDAAALAGRARAPGTAPARGARARHGR